MFRILNRDRTGVMFAAVAAFVFAISAPSVEAQAPNVVIEEAVAEISSGLDGRKDELAADRAALYAFIDDILLPRFDRTFAAQLVLARHWRTASEAQQQRFIDAFYRSMLTRYADGVLEFDQDRIEVLTYRGDPTKKSTTVKTIVQLNDGTKVPVDYGLVRRQDAWKLYNVTIEGVSYVKNFRAELDSEIRQSSLDAVIERLESESASSSDDGEAATKRQPVSDGPLAAVD